MHYTDPKELPGLKTQTIVKLDKPRDIEVDYEYKYDVTHTRYILHGQTLVLGAYVWLNFLKQHKFQSICLHTAGNHFFDWNKPTFYDTECTFCVCVSVARHFYFTDGGASPYIARCDYTGHKCQKIVAVDLVWPNGLTIDRKSKSLRARASLRRVRHVRRPAQCSRVGVSS